MIEDLEDVAEILGQGKVDPEVFWPDIGIATDVARHVAACGSVAALLGGEQASPALIIAAMQAGAVLALNAAGRPREPQMEI